MGLEWSITTNGARNTNTLLQPYTEAYRVNIITRTCIYVPPYIIEMYFYGCYMCVSVSTSSTNQECATTRQWPYLGLECIHFHL